MTLHFAIAALYLADILPGKQNLQLQNVTDVAEATKAAPRTLLALTAMALSTLGFATAALTVLLSRLHSSGPLAWFSIALAPTLTRQGKEHTRHGDRKRGGERITLDLFHTAMALCRRLVFRWHTFCSSLKACPKLPHSLSQPLLTSDLRRPALSDLVLSNRYDCQFV